MNNKRLVTSEHPIADTHLQLCIERGKNDAGVGRWVIEQKYLYLCKYIDAARKTTAKWSNLIYIDPFCGPGRIQVKNESFTRPNGAMTAWLQSKKSGSPFTKLLIGDISEDRTNACYERLKAQQANVIRFVGPAEETVKQMIAVVPTNSLCLVYVDPYNLELLNYGMIETLAKLKYVDFVFHFSTMDLARNVDVELGRGRFDKVAPGWQKVTTEVSKSNLLPVFFNHWQNLVRSLGYTCSRSMPLITNNNNSGIYNLVFYAKHPLPLKFWKDIAQGPVKDMFA